MIKRELAVIAVVSGNLRFAWETLIYLNNARECGHSEITRILVFNSKDKRPHSFFRNLEDLFPEVTFSYYEDKSGEIDRDIARTAYISLIRPYCLNRHFKEYPELEDKAILYTDTDILFLKPPLEFLSQYIDDDINYVSYAGDRKDEKSNYLALSYLESKVKDVVPEKVHSYIESNAVESLLKPFGLSKEDLRKNKDHMGGAQYLLKNIKASFWKDVYDAAAYIKLYLSLVNKKFFENEDKGFQSWCADMWAILFILWKDNKEVLAPKEMDFCWATDRVEKLKEVNIFHNAGITSDASLRDSERDEQGKRKEVVCSAFYKGDPKYSGNKGTPFEDIKNLTKVIEDPISQRFCTSMYVMEILKIKQIYNL